MDRLFVGLKDWNFGLFIQEIFKQELDEKDDVVVEKNLNVHEPSILSDLGWQKDHSCCLSKFTLRIRGAVN